MPTIDHKELPPIQPFTSVKSQAEAVAKVVLDPTISPEQLEAAVAAVLRKQKAEAKEAAKPEVPNWATLTEDQAMKQDFYIPVIEHDIPDYMNIKLKDTEYAPVWASKDQRRLGQLQAEGYEFIKKEHMAEHFKVPLLFDSEGLYVYADVVAMRVHKSILFSKRKRALQISDRQLKNTNRPPKSRFTADDDIQFESGFSIYEARL